MRPEGSATYTITPMTEGDAREVLAWRYEPPYDIYNVASEDTDQAVAEFLTPEFAYHSIRDADGDLIGFCCYGPDARVTGGSYFTPALDVGIGLRPDRTGQGIGGSVLAEVLSFATERYAPPAFRATIATWNQRSLRTFEKAGFRIERTFRSEGHRGGSEWVQVVREA